MVSALVLVPCCELRARPSFGGGGRDVDVDFESLTWELPLRSSFGAGDRDVLPLAPVPLGFRSGFGVDGFRSGWAGFSGFPGFSVFWPDERHDGMEGK